MKLSHLFFAALFTVSSGAEVPLYPHPDGRSMASFVARGEKAMVASADARASAAGLAVLRSGGNAMDAAVAVSAVISVLRPQSTGLGGGGFMLYRDAQSNEVTVYDFRERAPLAATRNMYLDESGEVIKDLSLLGHRAVAVPGLVAGLAHVQKAHARLPMDQLLAPAIRLAEKGFPVYPDLARALASNASKLARNPAASAVFLPEGEVLQEGELLRQPDLASTFEQIIASGADGFYKGAVGTALIEDMAKHGGLITQKDLDSYTVRLRKPVRSSFLGHTLYSMPPPSSGGIHLAQMLRALEGLSISETKFQSPEHFHLLIEVMRSAFADRAHYLGDPDFTDPLEFLTSEAYVTQLIDGITLDQARSSADVSHGTRPSAESDSTTHFSIVDEEGNCVSSTQTINYSFGSCVMVPGTGVLLNNEMDDFSINPGVPNVYGLLGGEANAIAPGKTPLSSMSPTIVMKKDEPYMVLGSPGGPRIITAVLQTLVNTIAFEQPLPVAVTSGRIHHQWMPDRTLVEEALLPEASIRQLITLGHTLKPHTYYLGDVQAIQRQPDGTWIGVSDTRVNGKPMGY